MRSVSKIAKALSGMAVFAIVASAHTAKAEIADFHPAHLATYEAGDDAIAKALVDPDRYMVFTNEEDRKAAMAFYKVRGFRPAWFSNGELTQQAKTVLDVLASSEHHGLEPDNYAIDIELATIKRAQPSIDLEISLALLRYARHAQMGQIDPAKISRNIDHRPTSPNMMGVLNRVASARFPRTVLMSYHPQHNQYWALSQELRRMMSVQAAPPPDIILPPGRALRLGVSHERVALLRQRLGITAEENPNRFDKPLRNAVIAFQKAEGLSADGVVGPRTLSRLNGENDIKGSKSILIANMERWRWMPRELGSKHILVNIPHFRVQVIKGDDEIYAGRVVVGKPKHMTPVFSDEMEHVVVNPYWNVPRSIARNEILPRLKSNPSYGYKYEVISASGRAVDPTLVNWTDYSSGSLPFRFRQPPGARNALGRVKFLFPNKHAVYLHDTPSRSLFSRSSRAFSHGCIRLHEPMKFADAVFSEEKNWNGNRVKRLVGGKESWVNLKRHIPVHLGYFTAWAGENGEISYRRDIYGHDRRMTRYRAGA